MEKKVHLLGDGWEPHVDQFGDRLVYSIPVESSFTSLNFEFEIKPADLKVLESDLYRYAVLFYSLHTLIGNTFGPSLVGHKKPENFKQADFDKILGAVLHSSHQDLTAFISKFDKDNNISLQYFVNDFISQKKKV